MTEILCETCGKAVNISDAIADGKYCSPECQWESMRKPEYYKNCPVCGIRFYANANGYIKKFCSYECACKGQTRPGSNPWARVKKICENCGKEFWIHKSNSARGRGRYCSQECVLRASGNETAIEAETAEALSLFGVDFIQQWKPDEYNRIFDFKVGQVTIEVNGDYWHSLPGREEVDKEKEYWARENGFIPVTIWEHEIREKGAKKLISSRVLPLLNMEVARA